MTRPTATSALALTLIARAASAQSAPMPVVAPNSVFGGIAQASENGRSQAPFARWLGSSGGVLGFGRALAERVSLEVTLAGWKAAQGHGAYASSRTSTPITFTTASDSWTLEHQTLTLAGSYQFLPNTWLQPFIAGGVEISRNGWTGQRETVVTGRQVVGNFISDFVITDTFIPLVESVRLEARPVGEIGLKAYIAQRAYVRGELHVGGRLGFETVTWQLMAGFDF